MSGVWRQGGLALGLAAAIGAAGCDRNLAPPPPDRVTGGPARETPPVDDTASVFGEGGLTFGTRGSSLFDFNNDRDDPGEGALPVNRYLWQAALDTLSFLPLDSTDPFTGVIATDWGATPNAPDERFKVTAYLTKPELTASALRVAVFRERQAEAGAWIAAPVNPTTATQLEDAILTRARQLRIADIEAAEAS